MRSSKAMTTPLRMLIAASTALVCAAAAGFAAEPRERRTFAPLALPTPLDPEKVALGRMLFSDPILSRRTSISCASCHDLGQGGTVRLPRTRGDDDNEHRFNAPTVYNVALNSVLGWQGAFKSLEALNEKTLLDPGLMGADWSLLTARLLRSPGYSSWFKRIYKRPPDKAGLLDALATFQRSLITPNARFDRYLRGDEDALTRAELEGLTIFMGYGCASCHQGMNLGGNMLQKFGIFPPRPASGPDHDRAEPQSDPRPELDEGLFRVPSLRNVAVTGPYFHDGRVESLPQAVSIMGERQLGRSLSAAETAAIVAFLNTLTGEYDGRKLKPAGPPPVAVDNR
ncbi:cytochrome-c peroxidase [Microvirga sesbaniae]|uniref:cytochrome-c peroxidase n=1 Tax=Microvirga sesbaniae TaxID=681392 RepID=UPI0021CABCD9|nr:cytochrome c peroxidase [Microvirga sp. HBU67692]